MQTHTLTAAQTGHVVSVRVGDTLRVELEENPTTGYRWQAQPVEGGVLEPAGTQYNPGGQVAGAGGTAWLHFRAARPGRATLRLELRRPWDSAGPAWQTFEAQVTVEP